jgi:hypothetical protein
MSSLLVPDRDLSFDLSPSPSKERSLFGAPEILDPSTGSG